MLTTAQIDIRVKFLTPVLGSQPTRAIASEFIAQRAGLEGLPEDEELTLPEHLERGTTVFHRVNNAPALFDYQVKGFLKEAGSVFNGRMGVRNLKSKIDNLVFVSPRIIPLNVTGNMTYLERPLRAMTMQGPRVSLARSEMLPEGTSFDCSIDIFPGEITSDLLHSLLEYGKFKGIGQWRNGSYGKFEFEVLA